MVSIQPVKNPGVEEIVDLQHGKVKTKRPIMLRYLERLSSLLVDLFENSHAKAKLVIVEVRSSLV